MEANKVDGRAVGGSAPPSRIKATWRSLNRLRHGIALRLLVGVLLFSSAITLVLTALQLYLDYRHDVGVIENRMSEIQASNLQSLSEGLWNLDTRQLELQVEGILRLPAISFVEVRETTDRANPMVVAAGHRQEKAGVKREFPLLHVYRGKQDQLGILTVEATLDEVYSTLLDKVIVILLSQGAKTFLVSFFILYIVHRLVTRHLTAFAGFLTRYNLRQPLPPLRLQRRRPKDEDELDQVVTAFETMRRNLERAYDDLRRSEAYLAEAQRLSQTGSWAWDVRTGEMIHWSQEIYRLYGFDPAKGPPSFDALSERVHPDDRAESAPASTSRSRRNRTSTWISGSFFRTARSSVSTRSGIRFSNSAGNVVEFVGTSMDVTERQHAEAERQANLWFFESMDRVNRAIQGTSDLEQMMSDTLDTVLSIFDCDRAWLVYPCDPSAPSWRAQMEHTRENFPGAFALGIELPMDADVADVFRAARATSGPVRFGPGSEHPLSARLSEDFSIKSLLGIAVYPKVDKPYMFGLHQCTYPRAWTAQEERLFREIARRLTDALTSLLVFRDLCQSEAKLEEAQRIVHVGYWDRDLDTDRITWSDEAYRIFGLAPQKRLLDFAALRKMVHPEDQPTVARAADMAVRGIRRYDVEYRLVRPGGEVRTVHSQGDVVRDNSGQPLRLFGTVQDITERKRAEEELHASERRYREVQMELAHVNRVTTMGQLTASIAHEVNQPIAATVANAQAALGWLGAKPPDLEEVREALARIVTDGSRAGAVVSRIHALIKKVPPRKDRFDINETILEVVALTRNEVKRNGVALETRLASGLPTVQGDRIQLQQVILNFIINAIEALTGVSEESRAILITTEQDEANGVRVAVRDSGPGLAPDDHERLFEAFYTTKPGGMGMGLSICRSIIEAHKGRVWASANTPRGAVFQFTLPAA